MNGWFLVVVRAMTRAYSFAYRMFGRPGVFIQCGGHPLALYTP